MVSKFLPLQGQEARRRLLVSPHAVQVQVALLPLGASVCSDTCQHDASDIRRYQAPELFASEWCTVEGSAAAVSSCGHCSRHSSLPGRAMSGESTHQPASGDPSPNFPGFPQRPSRPPKACTMGTPAASETARLKNPRLRLRGAGAGCTRVRRLQRSRRCILAEAHAASVDRQADGSEAHVAIS